ncbi:hypothetical protein XENOCAPTIV_018401, partial [Xenoophorus captivus]
SLLFDIKRLANPGSDTPLSLSTDCGVDKVFEIPRRSSNGGSHDLEEPGAFSVLPGHRRRFQPDIRPVVPRPGQKERVRVAADGLRHKYRDKTVFIELDRPAV